MDIDSSFLLRLELEDYVAIKQKAYGFANDNILNKNYLAEVNNYIINVLDYELTDVEAIVFSATALYPYDLEICELYNNHKMEYLNLKKRNIVLRDKLDLKEKEIEIFHLDKLINDGVLVPLTSTN